MITIEDLERRTGDRFLATLLVAKRARELKDTRPLTKERCERDVMQAAKELDMGLITYKDANGDKLKK